MSARPLKKDAITPSTLQILKMFFYYALVDISDEGMTEATTPTLRTSRGGTKQENPSSHMLTSHKRGDLAFS